MRDFAAIDFETANYNRTSICSVGIVVVRDGEIVRRIHRLVQPEPNFYVRWFSEQIHGIFYEDTCREPVFSEVWKEIAPQIEGLPLVAHNSGFDEGVLKATFAAYRMDYPDYPFFCTLKASRRLLKDIPNHRLPTVCERLGIEFTNHHDALADAEGCARIAMQIL